MPAVAIHDLAIEQDDLVAATYGRSFWILDDVTPLRQMEGWKGTEVAHLFAPRTAIRVRRDENQDTPLPPEVPAGKNPPDGAILNYSLAGKFPHELKLEIYDANGTLVRRYSSADTPKKTEETPFVAEYWITRPQPLSREAGMHRFAWNLRYADPEAIHAQSPYTYPIAAIVGATPLPPQGPLVLPGKYEVRLDVGEKILSQPLEVKMDPRVNAPLNELQSSLDLQLKISAVLARTFEAHAQVKLLRAWLKELKKRLNEDSITVAATALDAKAEALDEGSKPGGEKPKAVNLMEVNDNMTELMALVDGADFAPSEASFEAFRRVCKGLKEALGTWEELKNKDVEALNTLLEKDNLPAVPSMPVLAEDSSCGN
jgi:hypothetical protein